MEYDGMLFDLFGTLVDDDGQAIEGAAALLARLDGYKRALVTSCGRGLALGLIRHAGIPAFDAIVTSDDVRANKPAPDGYLAAARLLELPPGRCLVVEDSPQGIAAGRAAGMDVVAVLRGREAGFASAATMSFASLLRLSEALQIGPDGRVRL